MAGCPGLGRTLGAAGPERPVPSSGPDSGDVARSGLPVETQGPDGRDSPWPGGTWESPRVSGRRDPNSCRRSVCLHRPLWRTSLPVPASARPGPLSPAPAPRQQRGAPASLVPLTLATGRETPSPARGVGTSLLPPPARRPLRTCPHLEGPRRPRQGPQRRALKRKALAPKARTRAREVRGSPISFPTHTPPPPHAAFFPLLLLEKLGNAGEGDGQRDTGTKTDTMCPICNLLHRQRRTVFPVNGNRGAPAASQCRLCLAVPGTAVSPRTLTPQLGHIPGLLPGLPAPFPALPDGPRLPGPPRPPAPGD